ncbi:MAG TPA: HNH endonuclease, partial [Arthrobacter sp.]|nr:HNH endonuclease [Arthrobacter sp.]
MEAIGDQRAERSRSVVVLGRADRPAASRLRPVPHDAFDGGALGRRPASDWRHDRAAAAVPAPGEALLVEDCQASAAEPTLSGTEAPATGTEALRQALAVVNAAAVAAPGALAMAGYVEAADFADMAEELSRTVEYLQILGAGAVDRTRTQAI